MTLTVQILANIGLICGLLISTLSSRNSPLSPLHPLPDGHVYRDIQVVVNDQSVEVDVRLSSSDVTWIDLIAKVDEEYLKDEAKNGGGTEAESVAKEAGSVAKPESTENLGIKKIRKQVKRQEHLPLPTTEDEVSDWLTQKSNRRILQWWIAKHVHAKWGALELEVSPTVSSRQNGRHHWAISVEVQFPLPNNSSDSTDDAGVDLELVVDAFRAYPGQVRRAIKAKGDVYLESTTLPPLIVRADFETLDEKSTDDQRVQHIEAKLRIE